MDVVECLIVSHLLQHNEQKLYGPGQVSRERSAPVDFVYWNLPQALTGNNKKL